MLLKATNTAITAIASSISFLSKICISLLGGNIENIIPSSKSTMKTNVYLINLTQA
jgi:hypothetical protein